MRRLRYIIVVGCIISLASLFCGCEKNPYDISKEQSMFISLHDAALFINGRVIVSCNWETGQLSYNIGRKRYRIQKDDQSVVVEVLFSEFPHEGMGEVRAIITINKEGKNSIVTADFDLVKYDSDRYWFWNDGSKIGLVFSLE